MEKSAENKQGRIYIIRHGQTDWNLTYKLQGRSDICLNENGRQMAREAKEKYKDVEIDVCYSSPLQRAYETACIVFGDRNVPIIKDDRLMEMCFGEYEGDEKVIDREEFHPLKVFFLDPANYVASGGAESFDELYARTGSFIEEVVLPTVKEGKNIVIVGHGAMNLSIINQLEKIPVENFWSHMQKNCQLIEIAIK